MELLSKYVEFKNGKRRPRSKGDIPVYGGNGILDYTDASNMEKGVIIGRVGAYCGSVFLTKSECWVSDNAIKATCKENMDLDYLYYLLSSLRLNTRRIGTSQPLLTQNILNNLKVNVPDLLMQKKISSTLSRVDEKIANNNEINNNLEEQAQTIYRDTFVTNASDTWRLGHLSDLITVRYGKDHKKLADGIYPVYGSGGIMRYVEKPLYEKESILIPRKGSLNNVMYVNDPFWSVDTMFYTEIKLKNVAKFIFHFLKSKNLTTLNAGSAVPSMTRDILNKMELYIPDADTFARFEDIVTPMYQIMQRNRQESQKLSNLRDLLLPRLMSGEIDVSAIDI